jgi:tetratricopeptide (TPR) repeat protein
LQEAEDACRQAIAVQPDSPEAYSSLGNVLRNQKRLQDAEDAFRQAIAHKPEFAAAYYNLGLLFQAQKRLKEAEVAYRQAIARKPDYAEAYVNLGTILRAQRRVHEAEAAYRQAIARKPDLAVAYYNLGIVLAGQRRLQEAEDAHRQAIARKPDYAEAYANLGAVLRDQRRLKEAEDACRQAIAKNPNLAQAHYSLGTILRDQKRWQQAEDAYRQAIARKPEFAYAHGALGLLLLDQGQFPQASQALQKALKFMPTNDPWRPLAVQHLQLCKRLPELDRKLPAFLKGDARPADAAEALGLAQLCERQYKQRHAAAARFYAAAFAADPNLADDPRQSHRQSAARSAALAGCGQGNDAAGLDDSERAGLRRQALDWLRAELAARAKRLEGGDPVQGAMVRQALTYWRHDADFTGVRGDALAMLPEAERQEWRTFWVEVKALLDK